jgi:hypothetical protein
MSREVAVLLIAAVAVLLLLAMGWGWYRRVRRDRGLVAPQEVPADAAVLLRRDALYVATTRHGEPLERLAIRPLAYRSRATVDVTDAGIALALTGQPIVFVPIDRVTGAGRTTVAIDRVVETGGLVFFSWKVDADTTVDSILRITDGGDQDFLDAVASLHPAPSPSGDAS